MNMQAAGPDSAVVTGETVRLRFSVKGYDAPESWDIYWTGRQVRETLLLDFCCSYAAFKPAICHAISRQLNFEILWFCKNYSQQDTCLPLLSISISSACLVMPSSNTNFITSTVLMITVSITPSKKACLLMVINTQHSDDIRKCIQPKGALPPCMSAWHA